MGNYIKAAVISEFKGGDKKKVLLNGQEILLAKVGNEYFAIANKCPHMGGDLSAGLLEGNIVTCPRHGSQFDVKTGKNIRWMKGSGLLAAIGKTLKSPQDTQTYNVKVEGDMILIEI